MIITLTPSQALLLFGLLARYGEGPQADLVPKVAKADREALVRARLAAVEKRGRGLHLMLTDAGWAWAGANLSAALPPGQRTLHDLLERLAAHLATSGETLADFIGTPPAPGPASRGAGSKTAPPEPAASTEARGLIERAYHDLAGGRAGSDVPLAALRARLKTLDRASVDAALAAMHLEAGTARLLRIENSRALTAADREAALRFKGHVFHALWITS